MPSQCFIRRFKIIAIFIIQLTLLYRIMQIVHGGKFLWFSRISLQLRRFSSEFLLFYCKVFQIAVQSRKFPANNKIMQLRNFSTTNYLHYTVSTHSIVTLIIAVYNVLCSSLFLFTTKQHLISNLLIYFAYSVAKFYSIPLIVYIITITYECIDTKWKWTKKVRFIRYVKLIKNTMLQI